MLCEPHPRRCLASITRVAALLLLAGCSNDTKFGLVNKGPGVVVSYPTGSDRFLEGEPVTVRATVEDDHDEPGTLSYVWSADPGGALAGETLVEGGAASLLVADGFAAGNVSLTLEAIDSGGESGTDTVTFGVDPNTPPRVSFGAPADGAVVASLVAVDVAVAASDDEDEGPLALSWTGLEGPELTDESGYAATTVGPLAEGTWTLSVTVTDRVGATGTASITLTVVPGDLDGDGYADTLYGGDDCDDTNATIHPGATEICNTVDDDCDGTIDQGAADAGTWYPDLDGDLFGDQDAATVACSAPAGSLTDGSDCDDANPTIHPGADEVCNGLDDDCDGTIDEDPLDPSSWYEDLDADTYGSTTLLALACDGPAGSTTTPGDCDDTDLTVNPAATEVCNGLDDDCDGVTDGASAMDAATWCVDVDGDSYGDITNVYLDCSMPGGYTTDCSDCDDGAAPTNPGAPELCDGEDDDCDGLIDDDPADGTDYWPDLDSDGYGRGVLTRACAEVAGHVTNDADCDDASALISPAEDEICNDGMDNDCDGTPNQCELSGSYEPGDAHTRFNGANEDARAGASVALLDDLDGDGLGEVLIGGPEDSALGNEAGAAWLWSGSPGGVVSLADAPVSFVPEAEGDNAGTVVAGIGDMDRDTLTDFVITSPYADYNGLGSGSAYLWYGAAMSGVMLLADADAIVDGDEATEGLGSAVAGGDLDGDGQDDVILGAETSDLTEYRGGAVFAFYGAIYGRETASAADIILTAVAASDAVGVSLAAGDLDSDGVDDLLIGADGYDGVGAGSGAVYVVLSPSAGTLSLSAADYLVEGEAASDGLGRSIDVMGDINGDGALDTLLGAPDHDGTNVSGGGGWLFYGVPTALSLADVVLTPDGPSDHLGEDASYAGDINADGFDDVLIGARYDDAGANDAGSLYLLYGPVASGSVAGADAIFTGDSGDDNGGASAGGVDLDGDGGLDLVMGLRNDDDGAPTAGAVLVFPGGSL